ncbi:hypothetical protein R1flu_021041 [Riccia fluitans]|uniref:U1 small nuclear ribonucleoprotein C n=1 Tax=Riccia fluitans TaxID=41844 RepID=A0ABD1ZN85_9MARC
MPRYYCDYCDTYLTHDSPSVRKQHNAGYKHKANVRSYYQQFEEQQTQSLIDQRVKEHLGQTAAVYQQAQMGGAFHQHMTALGQFKPPIPLPVLPVPAPVPGSTTLPSIRPPVLPVPTMPAAAPSSVGYANTTGPQYRVSPHPLTRPPGVAGPPGQPPTSSAVMLPNGLPRPSVPPQPGVSSTPGAPGVPGAPVARSTHSVGANGVTSSPYSNTSLQQTSGYRNQNYNGPPGTTSYPQPQSGPPSAPSSQHIQQRGAELTGAVTKDSMAHLHIQRMKHCWNVYRRRLLSSDNWQSALKE